MPSSNPLLQWLLQPRRKAVCQPRVLRPDLDQLCLDRRGHRQRKMECLQPAEKQGRQVDYEQERCPTVSGGRTVYRIHGGDLAWPAGACPLHKCSVTLSLCKCRELLRVQGE